MHVARNLFALGITAVILGVGQDARASTFTSDITDFWWNASESGWGLNVTLQNDIAFATFYVYDTAGNPTWYSVALMWQGDFQWSGELYAHRGPWFGGAFNPSNVANRIVGAATFTLSDVNHATLMYTVDGVPVSEDVTRATWKNEDLTGAYAGGWSINSSDCFPASLNGLREDLGTIALAHTGSSVTLTLSGTPSGAACTFAGIYSQYGKLGQIEGSYSCSDGAGGDFFAYDVSATVNGFSGAMQGRNQYCAQWSGYVGGIKRAL